MVDTPAAAVEPDGLVLTMLADDAALEAVTTGVDGILDRLGEGGVHASFSTIAPRTARRVAEAHAGKNACYVSAPVFGRPEAAVAGTLAVVMAGDAVGMERLRPILPAISRAFYDFGGDPGAANAVKLAGNLLIASAMQAMAEAFTFGEKQGLERGQLSKLFAETLFDCPVYRNYGQACRSGVSAGRLSAPARTEGHPARAADRRRRSRADAFRAHLVSVVSLVARPGP